jgi:hypothetical protein
MSNLIRNERVKLLANWLNTIATGVITVGIFTPLVLRIYEMDEPTKNDSFVNAFTRCLHCRGARSPSR